MSDASEYLDPKEATEARLCAYLEGELPSSERSEIERHLAANPAHRQLLADLAKTREWMRMLPRVSAPPELAEAFQTQVERRMLLDDATDRPVAGRIGQRALLAAVLLLLVGLGVVVVMMLKGPKNSEPTIAINPPTTMPMPMTTPAAVSALTSRASEMASTDKPSPLPGSTEADNRLATARQRNSTDALSTGNRGGGEPADNNLKQADTTQNTTNFGTANGLQVAAAMPDQITKANNNLPSPFVRLTVTEPVMATAPVDLIQRLTAAGYKKSAGDRPVYVVVSSASPAASVREATDFFGRHQLVFDKAKDEATTQPTTQSADRLIVVPGVTRPQMESLAAAVSLGDGSPGVTMFADVDGKPVDVRADPAWAGAAIEKGQSLTVTIPQLVGRGTEAINTVKVSDDGTVLLPMLDPIPAAGATTSELEKRVATKYREAALIQQASVSVAINDPTAAKVATTTPTTIPADAMAKSSDGKFTAVVLIQATK